MFKRLYFHTTRSRRAVGAFLILGLSLLIAPAPGRAQSSGAIEGVVKDPSGAAIAGAMVEISYSVSGFNRTTTTGTDGAFRFTNVPFNSYHLMVTADGFASRFQPLSFSNVEAMLRKPCPVICSLVYPRRRSAAFTVFSDMGLSLARTLGKT